MFIKQFAAVLSQRDSSATFGSLLHSKFLAATQKEETKVSEMNGKKVVKTLHV